MPSPYRKEVNKMARALAHLAMLVLGAVMLLFVAYLGVEIMLHYTGHSLLQLFSIF